MPKSYISISFYDFFGVCRIPEPISARSIPITNVHQ